MQPRNCTSTLTQSKARAVSSESHFAAIRSKRGKKPCPSREERPAYPCKLRSVWLKRHSVLLGLPPPPPLIAAGPCRLPQAGNRAQDLAQGKRRRDPRRPFRRALTAGAAPAAWLWLPARPPPARSILLLGHRSVFWSRQHKEELGSMGMQPKGTKFQGIPSPKCCPVHTCSRFMSRVEDSDPTAVKRLGSARNFSLKRTYTHTYERTHVHLIYPGISRFTNSPQTPGCREDVTYH